VSELLTDRVFAGYRVDAFVGRGGMGAVYRATDLALDRTVALKVLAEELAQDDMFRRRFVAESRTAASLDHPNVIPIYAAGECDGVLYLAMRYVPGSDLRTVLLDEGRLKPSRAVAVLVQVAAALEAAHAGGLVHRDVKPANVLVAAGDRAYLSDFGLSKRTTSGAALTRSGEVLGTLDFIAPEQIRREPLGPATDIYALGCMTFQLLSGEVPFPADTEEAKLWAHLSERPARLGTLVEGIPSGFDRVVRRAMQKAPEDRFASAAAFADAIRGAADTEQTRDFEHTRTRRRAPGPPAGVATAGPAGRPVVAALRSSSPARGALRSAALDPFNVAVLCVLLAIGAALGTLALMTPMAVVVYMVAVALGLGAASGRRDG
jgi:serine/threonine protein kinase